MNVNKTHNRFVSFVFLHVCILIYSLTSIVSKFAAQFEFLSLNYILFMGFMVIILGLYAILWQQAIKPFKPSVAYSNKSFTTIWVLLASALIFGEGITLNNCLGAALIIAGVILVARDE